MNKKVKIHEVGLRDGLQNEPKTVPLDLKKKWSDELIESGLHILQAGSFVHPKKVPQMSDSDELFKQIKQDYPQTILSGLMLNEKGVERGMEAGVDLFCMGVSASEIHSMKNTGMSTKEATERILAMAKSVRKDGKMVQLSVQSAFGCGFAGRIDEEQVIGIIKMYIEAGFKNISLADTAGHAHPFQVKRLFERINSYGIDLVLTCHFHNTYALGMANTLAALEMGIDIVETSFGGLGGCPFTKSTAGNVSTEDLLHSLKRMGFDLKIDIEKIIAVSKQAEKFFNKELESTVYKSGVISY